MPTASDLVTDLPADFEVFGQAVATSLQDLLGGTTGQVLAKATNTNMDFTWVTPDDANAIQNAIVDAKGDLIGATAADTPARLAVGTKGQVLTADSAEATGLKWATPSSGGMTQLATGTLSGTAVTLSSISQSYKHLQLDVFGATTNTGDDYWAFRFNGLTAGSYCNSVYGHNGSTAFNQGAQTNTSWHFQNTGENMFLNGATGQNHLSLTFFDYTSATPAPLMKSVFSYQPPSGTYSTQQGAHSYKNSAAAITSLTIRTNGGQTFTAGTYILWGIA